MAKLYGNYGPVARPWAEIARFYSTLKSPASGPMKTFVRELVKSPYPEAGLQGLTSMADLVLGMNPSILDAPNLRIRYLFDAGNFLFTYPSGGIEHPERGAKWVRVVPAEEAFSVLERFLIKRVRWFRDRRPVKASGSYL